MNFNGTFSSTELIIHGWYKKNKRALPWRRTRDPYHIWLSEVILQQTRVVQGIDYYSRFINAFPDVFALARAKEDEVLKLWQGLGYYSRARNLHTAAVDVADRLKGTFPSTYEGLIALKGVGNYTASAMASICFGEPRAVVDGNVSRVIARLYGVEEPINSTAGEKTIASLAAKLMEESGLSMSDPGTHNQAMMEFGALQCVPSSPSCEICPLAGHCAAYLTGKTDRLPVKIPKRKPVDRYMYFYVFTDNGETILTRRDSKDIWRSLYQFPMVESDEPKNEKEMMSGLFHKVMQQVNQRTADPSLEGLPVDRILFFKEFSKPIRHQLTHRTIHARFIHVEMKPLPFHLPEGWIQIPVDQFHNFPVPRLIERYMEVAKF